MQFLSRSQQDFLVDIYKIVLKFVWDDKETRIAKNNLEKEGESRRNQFIKFQDLLLTYSDSNQDSDIGREIDTSVSRTENSEIDSYKYSRLIF